MADNDARPGFLGRLIGRRAVSAPVARVEPAAPSVPATAAPLHRHQVRRFKAAKPGRLIGGFGGLLTDSTRAEVRQDIRGLVNHARFAAQNVDFLKSYEMMVRRHVVGPSGL